MKIEKFNLTKENLLKIIELDKTFYHDKELTRKWYFERFKDNYEGIGLFDGTKLVGYLVASPIDKKLYDDIKKGKYDNDTKFDPKYFIDESDYYYFDSILILEEYRNHEYSLAMIEKLDPKKNYVAITISKEGFLIASLYMKKILKINETTYVFTREP